MKDTSEKILQTAFALMIKAGYNGVSTSDISNALGIARSLPYKHFKNKRDLFYQAFKLYFYDSFFYESDKVELLSLKAIQYKTSSRLKSIILEMSQVRGEDVSIFDYNWLYLDAIRNEPRFRRYMQMRFSRLTRAIDRAVKNKEIINLPVGFIERVFLDICCRCSELGHNKSGLDHLDEIILDTEEFYRLISYPKKSARK